MSLSSEALSEGYANTLQTLFEIAEAYSSQGKLEDAFRLWQTGEQLLVAPEVRALHKMRFLSHYGRFLTNYYYLTGEGETLMFSLIQRVQQEAEALQNEPGIATGIFLQGKALYFRSLLNNENDYAQVRDYFLQASDLQTSLDESYDLSESLFFIGLTYDRQYQSTPAEKYYLRALELADQQGNKWAASEASRHLTDHSEGDERLRYALRSLELRVELDLKSALPSAQLLLSDIFIERGELDQATRYCQQAQELATEMHLLYLLALAQLAYGEIAYKQAKLHEAREYFHKALEIALHSKRTFVISAARDRLAEFDKEDQ